MDQKYIEEMVCSRRKLHKIPEEGWTEFQTTYFVVEFLRGLGLPFKTVLSVHLKPAFRSLSLRKRKVSPEQLRYWTPDVRAQRQHLEVTWIASLFEKRKMLTIFRTS